VVGIAREQTNVPLAPLTTLHLGGVAARLVDAATEDDVAAVVADAASRGDPLFVLGGGSNVVVGDGGFAGVVLRMALRGIVARPEGANVVVDVAAGEEWDAFVAWAAAQGWTGVECLSGIPGRVGATPIQNVGAYGQEVKDTIASVRVFDCVTNRFVSMTADECAFGYRTSRFKNDDRFVVVNVRFVLRAGGADGRSVGSESAPIRYAELAKALAVPEGQSAPIARVRETVIALRRGKGMVVDPQDPESVSAGSFFVNPVLDAAEFAELVARAQTVTGQRPPGFDAGEGRTKVAAAWLVERAGFPKGWALGPLAPVAVSRKHALALVHRGGGTTRDLLAAARAIQTGVRARFGVTLEPEPVFVGCSFASEP
jgi:UDP-N-acetylmuramate dehydrogenase